MPTPTVRLVNVSRGYREGGTLHPVIKGVDAEVVAGECVALLGRSGSGKSTLLNLIAGIDRPDQGEVIVGGESVTRMTEPGLTLFRRRTIGFVYQFFNLIPTLTAAENVALPLELRGISRREAGCRVREMLSAVGLEGRAGAFPDQLSGGEQQRIAVARALVHRPPLVLADEPTGNLDQENGEQVLEMMFSLAREAGGSLLLVTHSLAVARRADRILTLVAGEFAEPGAELAW